MENLTNQLQEWIISNPWIFITSIFANIFTFIKYLINLFKKRKIGRAKLAAKRYNELLIPLSREMNDVRIETVISRHGTRKKLLIYLIKKIFEYITLQTEITEVKQAWKKFKNPIIGKPSKGFSWCEPNFEKLDNILNENRHLLNSEMIGLWYSLKEAHYGSYYSDSERTELMVEFASYVFDLADDTRDFLENKYPHLLVNYK